MSRRLVLVKHALPVPDTSRPAREWKLGAEGEEQAKRLARRLQTLHPFQLVSSPEAKTVRTAQVVADELGLEFAIVDGLHEIDRPVLPWMGEEEHARFNKRLFDEFDDAVVGAESARTALQRFEDAVQFAILQAGGADVVAITHGTVMSLLIAQHNADVAGFDIWQQLDCPSFVSLSLPELALGEVTTSL